MFKNLSPKSITLYIAILVSIFNLGVQYFFSRVNNVELNASVFILIAVANFILCYLIVRYFIGNYVLLKIRHVYNIIQKSKFGKSSGIKPSKGMLSGKVWENVETDVAKWADLTESEIENLKELEQYRKDFVGNISHELKTPIFSIQGYIHTLLEGGLEDEKVNVHFLKRAAKNVERLITIIDDLEVISTLESEADFLEVSNFNLVALVDEVISDFEVQAKKRSISISHTAKKPEFLVTGDREKIRQVFNNLIFNSIKYGSENGETIINFNDLDQYILVEVTDNGIGIEEKHLNHLFDRFYRIDKSRSRNIGGSGLGLSIVKHIVEAHKQTINVSSTKGKGSTFGFTIQKAIK